MFEVFTGVVRTPPIPAGHASISPRGSIALATDLARDDLKTHFAEFAYDGTSQQIRLRLMSQAGSSGYCWRVDKGRWRVEPLAAMKHYKLCPPERGFCKAWWSDGALYIQLPVEANGPEEEDRSKYAIEWTGKVVCPGCGKRVAYRWIEGQMSLRNHAGCERRSLTAAEVAARGIARPAWPPLTTQDLPAAGPEHCICSECGGRFEVTMRSGVCRPFAHRVNGKICKGTFQSPLPDDAESES